MYDNLDGSCDFSDPPLQPPCDTLLSTLSVVFRQRTPNVLQPSIDGCLKSLGLGNIIQVGSLVVTWEQGTWSGTIAPLFLPSVVSVIRGLSVTSNSSVGGFPLTGFPGLNNIRQVGNSVEVQDHPPRLG